MRGRRDPRRPVNIQTDVPVLVPGWLARVQAHPDPDRHAARPVVASKSALRRHAAADRIPGRGEHHEEAVPLGSHLLAAMSREGGAQ